VWWSVRPHFSFGTVEVRICDAQATAQESDALAALIVACTAQAARDHDEGRPSITGDAFLERRIIEENFWRAIRHGMDGQLIDFATGEERPAAAALGDLLTWTAPMRAELGLEPVFPPLNGAQRQRRAIAAGVPMEEVFQTSVQETTLSYAQEVPTT
jgi:carboxylate-amine ligase